MHAKNWALGATLLAGCMASGPATADIVQLRNVTASWYDASPTGRATYYNNDIANSTHPYLRWGTGGGAQSGYDFTVARQPIAFTVTPPGTSPTQSIGTFQHVNYPINAGSSIESVRLHIQADVWAGADGSSLALLPNGSDRDFYYQFNHWETDNTPDRHWVSWPYWHYEYEACADGGEYGEGVNANGCADQVTAIWQPSSETFTVGEKEYTLNITGFFYNGNALNAFWTKENADNSAQLLANVTLRENLVPPGELPEPPTLALLGLGLAGVGYASRRSRHRNSR